MSAHQPKGDFENTGATPRKSCIDSCVRPLLGADFNKSTNIQHSVTFVLSSSSRRVGKVIRIYVCSHENHGT
jgi:hypothetical protein